MEKISEVTRRDIFDIFKFDFTNYYGRLNEIEFLKRIYNLEKMPSTDSRFSNAERDIWQHTINNDDWESHWVFLDQRFELLTSDKMLLNFICEIFHPIVRNEKYDWKKYQSLINDLLNYDGYELFEENNISGRIVYNWKEKDTIIKNENSQLLKLTEIGRGSYAIVYSYEDSFYNKKFALKKAKKDINKKDLVRFKREYEILKKLNSPYIIEVYNYFEEKSEYIMEYMDSTLLNFIQRYNNTDRLKTEERFRLINQILRCFRFLHKKEILHRDISYSNILIKEFDHIRIVKLSDFGLVKLKDSSLTDPLTEFKGSLNDPILERIGLGEYGVIHETYALTQIILFILTGRINFSKIKNENLIKFMKKGLDFNLENRYQNIDELTTAVSTLKKEMCKH